jgi:DNA-binding TFAR19-related protein (PDSD5 family)
MLVQFRHSIRRPPVTKHRPRQQRAALTKRRRQQQATLARILWLPPARLRLGKVRQLLRQRLGRVVKPSPRRLLGPWFASKQRRISGQ